MVFNRFTLSVIIHGILLFAAVFLAFFFFYTRQQPTTAAGMIILALILLASLIYHVTRTNRILSSFLTYMHEKDPTLSYSVRYTDRNFRGLNESLEKLILEWKENRIDLEVQAHYLEAILNNVSTGIITYYDSGEIQTMNRAAREYLGCGTADNFRELVALLPGPESLKLSMDHSTIKLKSKTLHIIALNDISMQMEGQEIRSWKKLIRVINHEIMNSITPIITLAMAIRRKMTREGELKNPEELTRENLTDAVQSASIIEEGSRGLVDFIERYKKVTGLPTLKAELFPAKVLMDKIKELFREELEQQSIRLICPEQCSLELNGDLQMLTQVLINLVKNSTEALQQTKDPEIELSCFKDSTGHITLSVRDNGHGIAEDKIAQVFVPFFSTREKGSGIGLSLCKQIIQLHRGKIQVASTPDQGTTMIIQL